MSHINGIVLCDACGARMPEPAPPGWVMVMERANSNRQVDLCPCVGGVMFDVIADNAGNPEAVAKAARMIFGRD